MNLASTPTLIEPSDRVEWERRRKELEGGGKKHSPKGSKKRRRKSPLDVLIQVFGVAIRAFGLYERGLRNARDLKLTSLELAFEDLPAEFDGYTILQLSDLHVDALPENIRAAAKLIPDTDVDLCVLTGDYRHRVSGPFDHILPELQNLVGRIKTHDGLLGILGNHDTADMVAPLEDLGIAFLINETLTIRRGDAEIHLSGTDDVHYFYSDAATNSLRSSPRGFKIALVHSAEIATVAAEAGFSLYLAGHSHGGQVALPGGRPIVTRMACNRRYASGLWKCGRMTGYTSTGVGVTSLPVRFNTRGEIVLITLRSKR